MLIGTDLCYNIKINTRKGAGKGMKKSKKYSYSYEEAEEKGKGPETMVKEILADPDLPELNELIIGNWGSGWGNDCQKILDDIVENKEHFSEIEHLFIGDMESEECEISWIIQGNYEDIWSAMPQLKELTIQGSDKLKLGTIEHKNLEALTIICGGISKNVLKSIQEAKLPNLKKLLLYIGVEDYGFNGDKDTIAELLEKSNFPKLEYLGLVDSEIQNEITEVALQSKYIGQIKTLDLSCGTLTDKGGELLLRAIPNYPNIKLLDLSYNYLSEKMAKQLKALPLEVDVSDSNKPDEEDGWMCAMLTE